MAWLDYWKRLPDSELYEEIAEEIRRYKTSLASNPDICSKFLSKNLIHGFNRLLRESPYPMLEIIAELFHRTDSKRNQVLEGIVYNILIKVLDQIEGVKDDDFFSSASLSSLPQCPNELRNKLYTLLANFQVSEPIWGQIERDVIPRLFKLKHNKGILDDALYLCLLSRSSPECTPVLITKYLEYERQNIIGEFTTKSLFLKTVYEKWHWLESFLDPANDAILKATLNNALYQHVAFYRIIFKMDVTELYDESWWDEVDAISDAIIVNNCLKLCLSEMRRQTAILRFLKRTPHKGDLNKKAMESMNMLASLMSLQIDVSFKSHTEVRRLLDCNQIVNEFQLNKLQGDFEYPQRSEVNVLDEFLIVKTYLRLIQDLNMSPEEIEESLNEIKSLLKNIHDGNVLFQLMQTVLTLLFLRYEHIRRTVRKKKASEISSSPPADCQNDSSSPFLDLSTFDAASKGFYCSRERLDLVLNSLRRFLMELQHRKLFFQLHEQMQDNFKVVLDTIDNALWRLTLVDESQTTENIQHHIGANEWLRLHVSDEEIATQIAVINKPPTDDDGDWKEETLRPKSPGKKNKEHLPPVESAVLTTMASALDVQYSQELQAKTDKAKRPKSIIPAMLMSPESLVSHCMVKQKYENIPKIIEQYQIQETDVAEEFKFADKFRILKAKLVTTVNTQNELRKLIKKLQSAEAIGTACDEEKQRLSLTMEASFEIEKYVRLIELFLAKCSVRLPDDEKLAFKESTEIHPNLELYDEKYLPCLLLIELMISLPLDFDMNNRTFAFINESWRLNEFVPKDVGLPLGYHNFLCGMMKIITMYNNRGIAKTFADVLNDEVCLLDPEIIEWRFTNRQYLLSIINTNAQEVSEPMLADMLPRLQLFEADIDYMKLIFKWIESARSFVYKLLSHERMSPFKCLCFDNYSNIGKVIFDLVYQPDKIENLVHAMNINLPHAVAVSTMGFIDPPEAKAEDEKLLSLFHLKEIGATSIELQLEEKDYPTHKITSTDTVYYIKKYSFLAAYLVKEMQCFEYKTLVFSEPNFFKRMESLESIRILSVLYDNNIVKTSLNYDNVSIKKLLYCIQQSTSFSQKLDFLNAISEQQYSRNQVQFDELKDSYIEMLVTADPTENLHQLENISSVSKFVDLLMKFIDKFDSEEHVERLIRWCLSTRNEGQLSSEQRHALKNWMTKLKVYREITKVFDFDPETQEPMKWSDIKKMAESSMELLLHYLLGIEIDLQLCYELIKMHPIEVVTEPLFQVLIEALNNTKLRDQQDVLFRIIDTFQPEVVFAFYDQSLSAIRSLPAMVEAMKRIDSLKYTNVGRMRYQKFYLSMIIFESLGEAKCEKYWPLVTSPLLLIEQLLMNSKIETLAKIMNKLRVALKKESSCEACLSKLVYQIGETIVYELDVHHDEQTISNECLDLLLKLYAAKALDFQIVEFNSLPASTISSAVGSLESFFVMPKEVPPKEKWVQDVTASSCMSCKKSKFSLVTRRHHCRRCGRVVCATCSPKRIQLKEMYNDMKVRCCLECFQQIEIEKRRSECSSSIRLRSYDEGVEWILTGNDAEDQMVRDEFNFEYSPNVGLCIAITRLHSQNGELAKFLLFHCHRLELLLRPINGKINPEIDSVLVTRMLKCLACAAKIQGEHYESIAIINYAGIVQNLADSGCDYLIPKVPLEPLNTVGMRAIVNDLIRNEMFKLSLDLAVKWDKSGMQAVFLAWGITSIKAGCFQTAREKITQMLKIIQGSNVKNNKRMISVLEGREAFSAIDFVYRRPKRSSALIYEIQEAIESSAPRVEEVKTPTRRNSALPANNLVFRNSASEEATNLSMTMMSLTRIIDGDYGPHTKRAPQREAWRDESCFSGTRYYEESMFYLLNYGGHYDIFQFMLRNSLIVNALRYTQAVKVPVELFIEYFMVPLIKMGRLRDLIMEMKKMDATFMMWKEYLRQGCKFLEKKRLFHCVYQINLSTDDHVRAAMVCVRFYSQNLSSFVDLHKGSHHLTSARKHLQDELETMGTDTEARSDPTKIFHLKWTLKTINTSINLVNLQLELTKFMAECEEDARFDMAFLARFFMGRSTLPTLFSTELEKIELATMLIVCGKTVFDGFGISYKIIQESSLKANDVYVACTKHLAGKIKRILEVIQLVQCIKDNTDAEFDSDELYKIAAEVGFMRHKPDGGKEIEKLINCIKNPKLKIESFLLINQLKAAYLLSVQSKDLGNLMKIKNIAKRRMNENVRKLCKKVLQAENADTSDPDDAESSYVKRQDDDDDAASGSGSGSQTSCFLIK